MKKVLGIIAIIITILIIAIVATPFLFKNQISSLAKKEISKQMEADVDYSSVNISIFKHFPDLTLSLNDLSIVQEETDTLISMRQMLLNMETWSAITGNQLNIKTIVLNTPRINYVTGVADASSAEMVEEMPDKSTQDTITEEPFLVKLQNLSVINGRIAYLDTTEQMHAVVDGINLNLSGDFSEVKTLLDIDFNADNIFYAQEGETLIKGFPSSLKAQVDADLQHMVFTLKDNNLKLGVLNLELDGNVKESGPNYTIDLHLNAPVTDMSDLLGMLPESYASMMEGMKTDGKITINGNIKGDYVDMDHLPEFDFKFSVADGMFQYPDLPKSINSININATITHPDQTSTDAMVIRVDNFACNIGGNPIESKWNFTTPVSDLNINGFFKGNVDLATLKDVIPMEDYDIKGKINADIRLKGHMSAIEKEEYQKFDASGYMSLNGFWFKSNDVPQGISINESTLSFSPKEIDLKSFSARMGESDFTLDGKFSNYINYVFSDGTLKGKFNHKSNYINANEFLDQEDDNIAETDTSASELFLVPDKLDLVFTSNIRKMLFDNLKIYNTTGKITVVNRKAILDNLNMQMLDGSVTLTGVYNTEDTTKVFSDMQMVIDNIDVAQTTASFSTIRKLAPIATYAEGRISLNLNYYSPFMENGEIDIDKLASQGYLSSPSLLVKNNAALDELARVTQNPKYKDLKTGPFKANYMIENGKVVIKPFKVVVDDKPMEIWGDHALKNDMNYHIKTTVAANELGKDVANLVKMISDPDKQLPVTVNIKGSINKPVVSLDAKAAIKQLQKDASKGILNGLFK
ncbi:AsmA-like C-terminal region-containing protein [Saccharicrinis sp. FJH62]|uniref:DUF748 domain-containing protein n=1 Tax=Saccharicrinis sp. FJH62 TaxID=3344657 RepID=UPI0035D45ACD